VSIEINSGLTYERQLLAYTVINYIRFVNVYPNLTNSVRNEYELETV